MTSPALFARGRFEMLTKKTRVRDWFGLLAFYAGLCAIGAAGGLHIMYDRVAPAESLPPTCAQWCAQLGKAGVTLTCASLGLILMLLGATVHRSCTHAPSPRSRSRVTDVPLFIPPDRVEPEPSVTSYGRVVLRTQKYMKPPATTAVRVGTAQSR